VKVRIIRQPHGDLHGIKLESYRLGQSYDFAPVLANLLVVQGIARVEIGERANPVERSESRRSQASLRHRS
jgi:hypothetical protein